MGMNELEQERQVSHRAANRYPRSAPGCDLPLRARMQSASTSHL